MRAHECAARAVDADVRIPDGDLLGDRSLFPLCGAGGEGAVDGQRRDGEEIAPPIHHHGGDPLDEVWGDVWDDARPGVGRSHIVGDVDLGQTLQCPLDRGDVAPHHDLAPLAVALVDVGLDGVDGLARRDDAGDGEETRLEDGIDPSPQTHVTGDAVGVDHPQVEVLVDDLALDARGQVAPHLVRSVRAVDEEGGAVRRLLEHVDLVEEAPLMARHEVGLFDQVGRIDGFGGEAQVGHGLRAGLLRVVDEVALGEQVGVFPDDLDGALVRADGSVAPQPVEDRSLDRVWLAPLGAVVAQAQIRDVVGDSDGELRGRTLLCELIEDSPRHGRSELLGREPVAPGDGPDLSPALGERRDRVEIERVAGGSRFLRAVEHGHRRHRLGDGVDESLCREGAIEADDQRTHLLAGAGHRRHRLFDGAGPGAHDDDQSLCVRCSQVVEQPVPAAGQIGPAVHLGLHDSRCRVIERVACLPRLEEDVRVLGRSPDHRSVRVEGPQPMFDDQVLVDHGGEHLAIGQLDLRHLVAGPEPVEEVQERQSGAKGGGVRDRGQILCLLHGGRGQHRPTRLARSHHVAVIAEDRQGVGGDSPGGHVDHGGRELSGDLVHVGQHQQEPLGGGEGRGEGPCLERAMHCSRRPCLRLHLDHVGNDSPQVGLVALGPGVGELTHWRCRSDGVDGDDFTEGVSDPRGRLVAVDGGKRGHRRNLTFPVLGPWSAGFLRHVRD